ncbi:MAG: hypothetical protein ACTSYB_12485 [Candidatus Helarchaeota archaeon]
MMDGNRLISGIVIFLGGVMLCIAGIIPNSPYSNIYFTISNSFTFALGLLTIFGGVLFLMNIVFGLYCAITSGGLAFIGLFVQIGTFIHTPIYLTDSLIYIDSILIILGGLYGLIFSSEN